MENKSQRMTYAEAIGDGLACAMAADDSVVVVGQGVNNPWYVGNSVKGIFDRFGADRVIDPPVSEQSMNGVMIGAALQGLKPVVVHPRRDFLVMGIEQIINQAANWSHMFDGKASVPMVIRTIINRGGEQGAQH